MSGEVDRIFEVGDVVCLKSGGPPMTVRSAELERAEAWVVLCDWTDANGAPHQAAFRLEQLEPSQVEYVRRCRARYRL